MLVQNGSATSTSRLRSGDTDESVTAARESATRARVSGARGEQGEGVGACSQYCQRIETAARVSNSS